MFFGFFPTFGLCTQVSQNPGGCTELQTGQAERTIALITAVITELAVRSLCWCFRRHLGTNLISLGLLEATAPPEVLTPRTSCKELLLPPSLHPLA